MPFIKSRRFTFFLLVLNGLLVITLSLLTIHVLSSSSQSPSFNFPQTFDNESTRIFYQQWSEIIKNQGASHAYTLLKQQDSQTNVSNSHFAAHLFGELLYRHEGISGFYICDNTNAFGCYHGFIASAIQNQGESVIAEIDKACLARFGTHDSGCRHGIGHGLVEYLGAHQLTKALHLCSTIQPTHILGCTQGVFMEYNFPAMTNPSTNSPPFRKLDESNPYDPCYNIRREYQPSCFYEITQLWDVVFEQDYKKIGNLCGNLENNQLKEACYLGVGRTAAEMSNYNSLLTLKNCAHMPTKDAILLCQAGAYWLFDVADHKSDLSKLCSPGITYTTCLSKTRLIY